MNEFSSKNKIERKNVKGVGARSAKECAYLAAFVALVIALQLAFSFVPGVELVTVCFVTYSFAMGARRGMIAATAFSLLRQLVFGFYATVLVLYLVYFNVLALAFGCIGKKAKPNMKNLVWLVIVACIGTTLFTLFDNILTPIWYGYSKRAIKAYAMASLAFMVPQVICTAISVSVLFLPLVKVFFMVKRTLTARVKPIKIDNMRK